MPFQQNSNTTSSTSAKNAKESRVDFLPQNQQILGIESSKSYHPGKEQKRPKTKEIVLLMQLRQICHDRCWIATEESNRSSIDMSFFSFVGVMEIGLLKGNMNNAHQ